MSMSIVGTAKDRPPLYAAGLDTDHQVHAVSVLIVMRREIGIRWMAFGVTAQSDSRGQKIKLSGRYFRQPFSVFCVIMLCGDVDSQSD
jgi:hypothetical protein